MAQPEREQETKNNLGDAAPHLSAALMHLWVWEGARSLRSSRAGRPDSLPVLRPGGQSQSSADGVRCHRLRTAPDADSGALLARVRHVLGRLCVPVLA
jgi:hypothetical protein